ncbi:hypothetical protein PCANC_11892 [Puccinia coronata f. sp. avenae]|uniref:Uncharacterized protein n=1 Tax=Puccinia coronata f. sp. avenae TaxID=200324 RepID=A0A2N5V611_9BASI|nr:hypothetical protein PCANC_11892 [Puccinia coronata f. sp. avenae]
MDDSKEYQHTPNNNGAFSPGRGRGNYAATLQAQQLPELHQDSQSSTPHNAEHEDGDEPVNEAPAPPNAVQQVAKKLRWTGPMEVVLLELYVQEVEKGKQTNNGFQDTLHQHVAQQLRWAFPETKL